MNIVSRELIIIGGMHRSGTTILGKILGHMPGVSGLHEPFNPIFGINGLDIQYPYFGRDGGCVDNDLSLLIEKVCNLNITFKGKVNSDKFFKRIVRPIVGGKGGVDLIKVKILEALLRDKKKLLLKDPFLTMLTPYLSNKYNAKAVIVIRHPCAVWASIKRMGWVFSFKNFGGNCFWSDFSEIIPSLEEIESKSEIYKVAYLWKTIYWNALEWQKNGYCLVIKHEEFCLDYLRGLRDVCEYLGVPASAGVLQEADKLMKGANSAARGKRLHDFKRNSAGIIHDWKKKVGKEEESVFYNICGDLVQKNYGSWFPYD